MYKDVLSLYQRVHAGAKFLPEVAPGVGNLSNPKKK
jgi:hypothetical protein